LTRSALATGAALVVLAGCATALREPATGTDLLEAGGPRRAVAQSTYLAAARADSARAEGLLGLARVSVWRIEHEQNETERKALVPIALQAAQACARRDPTDPRCDYWLAVALGLQAREHPSTGRDGVSRMVEALRRVIARAPELEEAGPHRVLALVLLRAPGWPLGPGDAEAGLVEAKEAVALFPDHPPNQLALGEALARNGRADESRAAFARAGDLAQALSAAGEPDAAEWNKEAEAALARP